MAETESRIETRFDEPGTLEKPGPIGRLVRLTLEIGLAFVVWGLLDDGAGLAATGTVVHWSLLAAIAFALLVFPYVVNIGWGLNLKAWPRRIVGAILVGGVLFSWATAGDTWSPALGWSTWGWMLYTFAHLGISFLIAAVIGTPGCEMRAIPNLWTLLTGRETKEHYCPGFINNIDAWELRRSKA